MSHDGCKSHGHYIKASRMFRTSSWCSIRLYSGQKGRCLNVMKNSKVRMSLFGYVCQDTNGWNHGQVWKIQLFLFKKSVRSSISRTIKGKAIWENPLNAYSYTVKKRLFLSVYVDDIKLAGRKQNIVPTWKVLMRDVDMGEPTSFFTMFIWVALKECVKSTKILWRTTAICSTPGFLPDLKKN